MIKPEIMKRKIKSAHIVCDQISILTDYVNKIKHKEFPSGSKVKVDCDQYNGVGEVTYYNWDLPIDKIPVLLQNGNIWYYPFINCKKI